MNQMTIAEAYRIVQNDQLEREELIDAISTHTGATRKAILRKLSQLETEDTGVDSEAAEEPVDSDEEDWGAVGMEESVKLALLKENSKLKQQVKKLSTERGGHNILLEEIAQNMPSIKPLPMVYRVDRNSKKDVATLCLTLCDWHCGQVSEISQINHFDYNTLVKRVDVLIRKVLDWCELHRNSYRIEEVCLLCAGDFISGDIHDELIRTNEFSSSEQVVRVSELLSKVISSFSPHFKKVRVEFVTFDNHSRLTVKPMFSDSTANLNYVVGYLTKSLVRNLPNVVFNLYPVLQQVVTVQNRRYLLMHGNCIRGGGGGVPLVGIKKKCWAEGFLRMNLPKDLHFDKIVLGHFHSLALTDEVVCCPSIVATADYDTASSRTAKSAQLAWLVSGRYEFDFIEFYLNEGERY